MLCECVLTPIPRLWGLGTKQRRVLGHTGREAKRLVLVGLVRVRGGEACGIELPCSKHPKTEMAGIAQCQWPLNDSRKLDLQQRTGGVGLRLPAA